MVKYPSLDDENFKKVALRIVGFASTQERITENWNEWQRAKGGFDSTNHRMVNGLIGRAATKSFVHSADGLTAAKRHPGEFVIRNNIPYMRNEKFVGRESQLSHLDSTLNGGPGSKTRTVILHGTGGIGKTQLAIEFAYAHSARYSSIFWLDGSSLESTERSIAEAARLIKRHYQAMGCEDCYRYRALNSTTTPDDMRRAFHDWLFDTMNRDWLVIFDNVDDLESFDIKHFVPHADWGRVIITSRRSELVELGTGLHIDDMAVEEALELLQRVSHLSDEEFKQGISAC